jgi:hypothetical protein
MGDKDRFCRQCGAPVATLVGDLIDTFRFNPDAPPSLAAVSQAFSQIHFKSRRPFRQSKHRVLYTKPHL